MGVPKWKHFDPKPPRNTGDFVSEDIYQTEANFEAQSKGTVESDDGFSIHLTGSNLAMTMSVVSNSMFMSWTATEISSCPEKKTAHATAFKS